ncbi:MAG: magnesium transporter CorA family protein [Ignavibacteria bacterium]|jgi:magnesium transporter|nr:magnesium transporter CorA family protein [Ignavibacteria bacterium]
MISFYNNKGHQGLTELTQWEEGCWTNVFVPTRDDIEFLVKKLDVPIDFLNDIEDIEERPRIDDEGAWTLIIMRIPIRINEDMEFATAPIGIMMNGSTVVSVCFHTNEIIQDFILFTHRKGIVIDSNINFLLRLILCSSVWYHKYLKHINNRIKMAEKELEKSIRNDELQALMRIEKVLVYFTTSLQGNELLLYKLKNVLYRDGGYDEELFEDVEIEIKQAISTTNIYSNILTGMMDAYASIVSNNVNDIMKKLTSITIILTLPNIISGLFGMNVPNLLEHHPFAFVGILSGAVILSLFAFFIFKKSKFF